jgi:hypothetical protein
MDDQAFGELIGKVNAIKENTDKIPDMATSIALHDAALKWMTPLIVRHEKQYWMTAGVTGLCATLFAVLEAYLWYAHG